MPERPDRCIMIGQPRSFNLARYFVDFVRDDRPPRGMLQGSTLGRPGSVLNRQNKRHRAWMPLATGKSLVRLPGDQLRTPRRPRVGMLDHLPVWRCRRTPGAHTNRLERPWTLSWVRPLGRNGWGKRSALAADVYAPSQPSALSRSSTQERSTFPAMVAALVFSSARSLALAAA